MGTPGAKLGHIPIPKSGIVSYDHAVQCVGSATVSAPSNSPQQCPGFHGTKDTAFDHPRLTLIIPLDFTNSAIKLSHVSV